MYRITRSQWRKTIALALAIGAFFLLYETRILDSQRVADLFLGEDTEPAPGATLRFSATAYCKGTTTAAGVRVRHGIAAADPAILPLGSVVDVATGDATYDGIYTVLDTGPEINGRDLDLYIWSCHEALEFGRQRVEVTILRLGWEPTASTPSLIDRLFRRREDRYRAAPPPPPTEPTPAAVDASPDEGMDTRAAEDPTDDAPASDTPQDTGPSLPSAQGL